MSDPNKPQARPHRCEAANTCSETPTCPVCRQPGQERKQKWFCPRCGQLIMTCCD